MTINGLKNEVTNWKITRERIIHLTIELSAIFITISVTLYEVAHPLLGKPIDPWDIIATVLTGAVCLIAYKIIHPFKNEN